MKLKVSQEKLKQRVNALESAIQEIVKSAAVTDRVVVGDIRNIVFDVFYFGQKDGFEQCKEFFEVKKQKEV